MGIDLNPSNQSNQLITTRKGNNLTEAPNYAGQGHQSVGEGKANDDTFTLSTMASILSTSVEGQAFGEVVNRQRVEQIRTAIEEGNYKVDPKEIAQKLLRVEEGL